jgi:hypothetical protein
MKWSPPDEWSYAYLLGMYLGDGCISRTRRTYQLVVVCDAAYPDIIEECATAMMLTLLPRHVRRNRHPVHRSVRVVGTSRHWPDAFPQHGPGRKHDRPIALAEWKREIVDRFPREFLRGLLHSDGCRTINRFSTKLPSGRVANYEYPRWFFSNLSADIRELFCRTCESVGVRWTQSNPRNIGISHRDSVALLDEFVGLKA